MAFLRIGRQMNLCFSAQNKYRFVNSIFSSHCTQNYQPNRQFAAKTKSKKGSSNAGGGVPGDFICHLKDVGFSLQNGKVLFDDVNLSILRGAKIGILGSNGCGKTTLIKAIAKVSNDVDGEIWHKEGLRVGYLQQEPELDPSKTVYENIMDGLKESQELLAKFDEVSMAMGEEDADFDALLDTQAKLQEKIDDLDCWDLSYEVDRAMAALRVPPGEGDVSVLSGGERRRVALCRLLLEKPDILLLDEPTNHLDAESVRWLEEYLLGYRGTVLSITHDRYFLDNVAGWILEIERGKTYPYEGNYSSWLDQKQKRLNLENKREAFQAKQLQSERDWIASHQGGKKGSKSRLKQVQKAEDVAASFQRIQEGQIIIPPGPRLGSKVIVAKNLSKVVDDGRVLFENLSFEIGPNSIVGIVGGNGSGKTTLFNILSGITQPDTGSIEHGTSVQLGFVSQNRAELNPKHTVFEAITGDNEILEVNGEDIPTRSFIASFNLRGPTQEKKVSSMSGGERNRVHLAKEMLKGNNVILLDEPTNDLDIATLRALENALLSFNGTAMVISHDRWFLDRICTHIIAFEGDSKVVFYEGNYKEYENYKK